MNHSQVQVTNRTEFLSEYWLVIGRLMKRLEGPTVNHKKVKREKMGRQIREKMNFNNFEPAAKIIYFRKTKNRISIMTCVDLLYTFLKKKIIWFEISTINSFRGLLGNEFRIVRKFGAKSASCRNFR